MRKKFFVGDKLNDLIHDAAEFICNHKLLEYHVFTFKKLNHHELNPKFVLYLWYAVWPKDGSDA